MNSSDHKVRYFEIAVALFVITILFTFIKKISLELSSYYFSIIRVLPFLCIFVLVQKKIYLRPEVRIILVYLAALLSWGTLITIVNGKDIVSIPYQYYHEIKYTVIFVLLYGISTSSKILSDRNFNRFVLFIYLLCILDLIFREVNSSLYDNIYIDGGHKGFGDLGDFGIIRHAGIFWHSSQLAFFSSLVLLYYYDSLFSIHTRSLKKLLIIFLSIVMILASKQNFELLSIFLTLLLAMSVKFKFIKSNWLSPITLFILFFSLIIVPAVMYFANLGLGELADAPRFIFFKYAYQELLNSNLLGSGWGTLGSHAAADVTNAYDTIIWQQYWWVKEGLYFYDTFWPHIIAELGIPGLLISIVLMSRIASLFQSLNSKLMYLFLVLTSLSTSNVQSFFYLIVAFTIILASERKYSGFTR